MYIIYIYIYCSSTTVLCAIAVIFWINRLIWALSELFVFFERPHLTASYSYQFPPRCIYLPLLPLTLLERSKEEG